MFTSCFKSIWLSFLKKGMAMAVLVCIGTILYFIIPGGPNEPDPIPSNFDICKDSNGYNYAEVVINDSFESIMLCAMILASLWAYYGVYKLDINPNPISFLDDLLLIICIPSFFLLGLLNIISGAGGQWLGSSIPTNIFMVSFF